MRLHSLLQAGILSALVLLAPLARAQEIKVNIPYEKFVLPNGLTVLVHEDHKAPIVAVNVWYHVGSKNEKIGRTGFAHLFEHLMFNGSEHFNNDYFKVLEKLGATDMNGTTNEDRTNYFQNVPTAALDTVLWMESDRMGHLLGVIDQARLDEQRGVVQNEKRQGENEPYGLVYTMLSEQAFPAGHPYSWPVIGSMEDLNAASLKDVQEWFKRYYGPSNAVLVLAGDIDSKTAKEKVARYFGNIEPGPPLPKPEQWVAKREGTKRVVLEDRVPQARIYKQWNVPPAYRKDNDELQIAAAILGQGKSSRLYKRLVYTDQLATEVFAYVDPAEIAGTFLIQATAKPGADLAPLEKALNEELARFVAEGPTAEELKRAKTQYVAGMVRGVERIGGFGGKSDVLARGQVFAGNPDAYKTTLANVDKATADDLRQVAKTWISDGVLEFEVRPFAQMKASGSDVDRSEVPDPGPAKDARFPKLERATLPNGLNIILAECHQIPVVEMAMVIDAGYAADQLASAGTATLTSAMLNEGTKTRGALQIGDEAEALGAQLYSYANLDTSWVRLSALKAHLDPSIELFGDVILNPTFPAADFARRQKLQLARIEREKVEPFAIGLRVLPALVYGKEHAYSNPLTGSGTEKSVSALTRDDLVKFHATWFHPNNATLIIVGDTTMNEIRPKLEKLFVNWKPAKVPSKNLASVTYRDAPAVYLLDRPGSLQSIIVAAHIAPPRSNPDEIMFETLNSIIGGMFTSRLNMNLREDKHWSYGAGSFLWDARGQRPFLAFAPVQTDKTKESLIEINRELREALQSRPVTAEELAMAQGNQTLRLPGSRETSDAVLSNIGDLIQYNLPDDYFDTFPAKVRALTLRDMSTAVEKLIHPNSLVWVVVGDRAKIEAGVREVKLGELHLLDPDGNPMD